MLNQLKLQSLLPSIEDTIKKPPSSEQIIALANLNKAFLNGSHETKKQNEDVLDLSLPNRSRLNNTGNEMYNMMLAKSLNYSNQSTASSSLSPLSSISNLSENAAKAQHSQPDEAKYEPQPAGIKRPNQHDENEDEVLNLKQDKSAKRAKLEPSSLESSLLQQFINQKQLSDAASLQNLLLQQQQQQQRQKSFSKPQSELNEQNLAACLLQLANKQQKEYLISQNMLVANLINSNRAKAAAAHNQMSAYAQLLQQQQQQQQQTSSGASNNAAFGEQSGELFGQSKMLEFLSCFKLFSGGGANPLAGLNANLSALSQLAGAGSGLDAHSASSIEGLTLSSLTNGGL
jgi:hypothetical protein